MTRPIKPWPPGVSARPRCAGASINWDAAAVSDERKALLASLFGAPTDAFVTAPFFCDYGSNIRLG